jgi:pyruvate dehydrogenase E2 component (dihydrolipoamide acetyltransferase)
MSPIAVLSDEPEEAIDVPRAGGAGIQANQENPMSPLSGAAHSSPSREPSSQPVEIPRRPLASPAAKALARDLGVDLGTVIGTGPDQMIVRRDVRHAPEGHWSARRINPMAAITSKSAAEIPHFYVTVDVEVSTLLEWRERWNASHNDLHASINDLFVRAASLALRDVPQYRVRYKGGLLELADEQAILVVVAVESQLMLLPIADPSASTWETFLTNMRKALEDARQHRVALGSGATPVLAVSNLGMFGVKHFTAIIPPHCTAVLAIGAVRDEVTVKDKQMKIGQLCSLTLGSDHRVVDGIAAAKFLERVQVHLNSL